MHVIVATAYVATDGNTNDFSNRALAFWSWHCNIVVAHVSMAGV
jgi:hypothetical protein